MKSFYESQLLATGWETCVLFLADNLRIGSCGSRCCLHSYPKGVRCTPRSELEEKHTNEGKYRNEDQCLDGYICHSAAEPGTGGRKQQAFSVRLCLSEIFIANCQILSRHFEFKLRSSHFIPACETLQIFLLFIKSTWICKWLVDSTLVWKANYQPWHSCNSEKQSTQYQKSGSQCDTAMLLGRDLWRGCLISPKKV